MRFARRLRRIIVAALFVLVAFVMGALVTRQPGNPDLFPPKPGEAGVTVYVVAYVYHSGLALPIRELSEAAENLSRGEVVGIADRFKAYGFVEIGWGDEGFYRLVPTISQLEIGEAMRALPTRQPVGAACRRPLSVPTRNVARREHPADHHVPGRLRSACLAARRQHRLGRWASGRAWPRPLRAEPILPRARYLPASSMCAIIGWPEN